MSSESRITEPKTIDEFIISLKQRLVTAVATYETSKGELRESFQYFQQREIDLTQAEKAADLSPSHKRLVNKRNRAGLEIQQYSASLTAMIEYDRYLKERDDDSGVG